MDDREMGHEIMTPELIIECAPVFLKAYYEIQRDLFQHRLDNFERVNWTGLKQTMVGQLSSASQPVTVQSAEISMRQVLQWIEDCISD